MRVTLQEAKSMLCPMKLGYSMADKFCEGEKCMAFKCIGADTRWNAEADEYETSDIFLCGLARVL